MGLTQHQMVNIGIGNDPDQPLKYVADVLFPEIIMPLKAHGYATSEADANQNFTNSFPGAEISNLRLA